MYSYERAVNAIYNTTTKEEMAMLLINLADTIGWWESDERHRIKNRADKDKAHRDELRDKDEELEWLRLSCRTKDMEILELKEERDQLLDENVALSRRCAIISAIEEILKTA